MATIQVRVDDNMKSEADALFSELGLDTSTAVRIFIAAAIREGGMPFAIRHTGSKKPNAELREAMEDARLGRNLHGPYSTAEAAVGAMIERETLSKDKRREILRSLYGSVDDDMPFYAEKTAVSESWSEEYVAKMKKMWESPDPTFVEHPEPPFTERGELFA